MISDTKLDKIGLDECPFCGGDAKLLTAKKDTSSGKIATCVTCSKCGARGPVIETEITSIATEELCSDANIVMAIASWNHRSYLDL